MKTRLELEENQMKRFHWEQDQIAHMKVGLGYCPPGELTEGVWGGEGLEKSFTLFSDESWDTCPHASPLSTLFQNYIARFGHGSAKLARQAQSKEKTLQKMMASGLTERVVSDKVGSGWVELGGLT